MSTTEKQPYEISGLEDITKMILQFYGKFPGVFLDIGSSHPINSNNTFGLEASGWSGLCVEPVTKFNEEYKRYREFSILENSAMVGLDYHDKFIKAYVSKDERKYNVTGIDIENKDDFIFWQTSTIDSLLKKHSMRTIDFFSLSVGGYEHEVLEGVDFNYAKFGCILIELSDYSWNARTNDFSYLKEHGYSYTTMVDEKYELWVNNVLPAHRRTKYKTNL